MANRDRLLGTLDILILRVVSRGPLHGYAIARRIEETSSNVLSVQQGSLYPALHRLERKAYLSSSWSPSPTGKALKTYTLTRAGEAYLGDEVAKWESVSAAVNLVLKHA